MSNSQIPEYPSLEYLKKLAKNKLKELRGNDPDAKLSAALLHVAREYGFPSWRALKAQTDERRASRIPSPAMRFLPVADANRSIAFYRDVLGFEIKPLEGGIEAVLGPARIRFGREGYSPADASQSSRPPGSAILFFRLTM